MARLRVTPKLTSSSGVRESTTPRPAGVTGSAPATLAMPYAANNSTGLTNRPNAATKHHSEAASRIQFSAAQVSDSTRTRRSRASVDKLALVSRITCSKRSPTLGNRRPSARMTRTARSVPRVTPSTSSPTASMMTAPMMATVT